MPKAGLGNQLFPLMKAVVFQQIMQVPLMVTNYYQFALGPYLRGEKSKRRYHNYFTFQKNLFGAWINTLKLAFYNNHQIVDEPSLNEEFGQADYNKMYIYSAIPHWTDYFKELKDHRQTVLQSFFKLLSPNILKSVNEQPIPCIGVHIRMGDFRKLKATEDFAKVGAVRTPETYFVKVIKSIRELVGRQLPVTVFTDGYRHEFHELFQMPFVEMTEGNADIVDMILLSKSKVIVTSAGSTFSYWAGFLSESVLIMHPDHIHETIRPVQMGDQFYEGAFDANNELLKQNILSIHE